MYYDKEKEEVFVGKLITHTVIVLVGLVIVWGSFGTVSAGQRGVLLQFGAVTGEIKGEGLYFKLPLIQTVEKMDVRIQKEQTNSSAASSDLQTVTSIIALNFNLVPDKVARVWQEFGADYKERMIDPAIQEAVKSSTAKFTAEELITKREIVREEIKTLLREKLEKNGVAIDEFNIIDFDFSKSFNEAIEAKVTAEQSALAAKNKLEQVKFEAQQAIEAATGKAKAIQIEGDALRTSPQVTELRYIEKWDGKMPLYWGSATPFVGLPQK